MSLLTEPKVNAIRAMFPVTAETVYLYNGNISPCATPVREAMEHFIDTWSRAGDAAWDEGFAAFEDAKVLFGRLVGCDADTLCLGAEHIDRDQPCGTNHRPAGRIQCRRR